jgi:hypothetical protein
MKSREEVKELIKEFWFGTNLKRRKAFALSRQTWINELHQYFKLDDLPEDWTFNRKLWHFCKGTKIVPLCPVSGLPRQFKESGRLEIIEWLPGFASGYTVYSSFAVSQQQIPKLAKNTCLQKYGVTNPFQLNSTKEKIKDFMLENYGVEFVSQREDVKVQKERTMLENYGRSHNFGNNSHFMLAKYGVRHNSHIPEIAETMCYNRYKKRHKFTLPSGQVIELQGYEPFGLVWRIC